MFAQTSSEDSQRRRRAIRRSALWAAWGDALGFITERADADRVRYRVGSEQVQTTVPWRRKVGGRTGPLVELPAGCISDDTQLRLSTSRAIRGDGTFDVEPFAKIELTIWPTYALGAGRGSQAAATHLRRRDIAWDNNFFNTKQSNYLHGGGNGAAMRIQPHVWSAPSASERDIAGDIVVNAVCTHGHPRGIVGALFHADCLHETLRSGSIPPPDLWPELASRAGRAAELAHQDRRLSELWVSLWEQHQEASFAEAVANVVDELLADLERCASHTTEPPATGYRNAVEALDARSDEQRGSAVKTSVLALLAAHLYAREPREGLLCCANELWTDTDTIATMAGALLGAIAQDEPPGPIADSDVILAEADRMWAIAEGTQVASFPYPSLLTWVPPKTQLDAITADGDRLHLAGLGPAGLAQEVFAETGKNRGTWEWLRLWFDQQVLTRRRPRPVELPKSQRVEPMPTYLADNSLEPAPQQMSLRADVASPGATDPDLQELDVHALTDLVIANNFDEKLIGEAFLELSQREHGVNDAIGFAAIIAKATATRRDRERRRNGT